MIIEVFIFLLGAMIGSFLNVCIIRMPHEESVVLPRSHCVHCKKLIAWYDNIPFISYLLLRGRCRFCQKKISIQYFCIELLTAIIFVLFYKHYGFSKLLFPYIVMTCGFVVATLVDFHHRIIPNEISVGGMFAGLIFSLFIPEMHDINLVSQSLFLSHVISLGLSLLGVLVGGGIIYLMGIIGDFIFKKESMGGGDIKLLAMIGAFLGWEKALLAFFIAPFFGSIFGILEKIRTNDNTIPYGPFLVIGALISLFYGDRIILYIQSGYGIF